MLLFWFPINAAELAFDHLNKLYRSNDQKCLNHCKTLIKYLPKQASPYFFAGKISFDKLSKNSNLKSQYNKLNSTLNYWGKFEKYTSKSLATKVNWIDYITSTYETIHEFYLELENAHFYNECELIRSKWNKTFIERNFDETVLKKKLEVVALNYNSTTQYYGIAMGIENVKSFDLTEEKVLINLINDERTKMKLSALSLNEDLCRAARYHAYDMGTQNYFSHNSNDLTEQKLSFVCHPFDRIERFYDDSSIETENIAAGSSTAQGTYNQWFTSTGHYKNMFNSESTKVGIGVVYIEGSEYGYYWVFCTAQ